MAGVHVPGVISSGTITDTAQGSIVGAALSSETTAKVEGLNLVTGVLTVDAVTADSHASSDGTTSTVSDTGSSFVNLEVLGHPEIGSDPPPNTRVLLAGLGTLWLHRVIQGPNSIEVRMIELIVGPNNQGLPLGLDVRVSVAAS